jgi:hypothetical protein
VHHESELFVSDVVGQVNGNLSEMIRPEDLKVVISILKTNVKSVRLSVLLSSDVNIVHKKFL